MNIEIHGGQFGNKGAMKMLIATIESLRAHIPEATFYIDKCCGTQAQIQSLGLRTFTCKRGWMGSKRFRFGLVCHRLLAKINKVLNKNTFGLTTLNEMDVLIDISGFAYSDQWGYRASRDFAKLSTFYRKNGKKIVMLPQAFGPFNNEKIVPYIRKIISNADRIFARDKISSQYLKEIAPYSNDKIKVYPDITLFSRSALQKNFNELENHSGAAVAIIPNARMLDQGNSFWRENYTRCLDSVIGVCISKNVDVYFLIHDSTGEDIKVAELVNDRLSDNIRIESIEDPWVLKSKIAECKLVVGSRFHGLVAALSSAVPVLAIGWSHKYPELLADFNCSDCLIDESNFEGVKDQLERLLCDQHNQSKRASIFSSLSDKMRLNEDMWVETKRVLLGSVCE